VELRAAVGDDDYAVQALTFLKKDGVDLSQLVTIPDSHTGLAFINVADDGENQIAVASGANDKFMAGHLTPITADGIITQFEIPLETIEAAINGFDGFVAINASPVVDGLERLLPHASLIIVNEGEYAAYKEALGSYEGMIAITLGAKGAKLLRARPHQPAQKSSLVFRQKIKNTLWQRLCLADFLDGKPVHFMREHRPFIRLMQIKIRHAHCRITARFIIDGVNAAATIKNIIYDEQFIIDIYRINKVL